MGGVIAWFVNNRVATNLLMWILFVGGISAYPQLRKEEFPNFEFAAVSIVVPYPGASPSEVESSVCIRIEEAIDGVLGVKRILTTASENSCRITAEIHIGYDRSKAAADLKSKVDAIDTFPAEAEKPVVSEVTNINNVLQIVIYGDVSEKTLKVTAEQMREDLLSRPEVSQVFVDFTRPYEVSIELSEKQLRKYQITMQEVADIIRRQSLDLPGGSVKTTDGEIILRTTGQARTKERFELLPILNRSDGTVLYLGDVANVVDGFEESDLKVLFDGSPAAVVVVKRIGDENVLKIAREVKQYVHEKQQTLPEGLDITIWRDESQDLVDRLDSMGRNAMGGLILVLVVLTLFLRFRLAFWVAAGIPIALCGTIMAFPFFDVSISTVSVMGIVLVLGIIVDDAIVVGERIYAHQEQGKDPKQAAIDGTKEVSVPVIFGVLTTMTAFMPLMAMKSSMGPMFSGIGLVAIIALFFSIVESQWILPMHLSHVPEKAKSEPGRWQRFQMRITQWLSDVADQRYSPLLAKAMGWRYFVGALAVSLVILMLGLVASGRIVFQFFPPIESSRLYAELKMTAGAPVEVTERAVAQIERAGLQLRKELNQQYGDGVTDMVRHSMSTIGVVSGKGSTLPDEFGGSHIAEVTMELSTGPDFDGPSTGQFASRWRELTGPVAGIEELKFTAVAFSAGDAIDIRLEAKDREDLKVAAAQLKDALANYGGVFDIGDSFAGGKRELQMSLLPQAHSLGVTTNDLARQIRQAFYGEEVQRLTRGREDIKVMLRYPPEERRSLGDIENMRIRTAGGSEVPFSSVARVVMTPGVASIERVDGNRTIDVYADVNRHSASPEEIVLALQEEVLPTILKQFPGMTYSMAGEQEAYSEASNELAMATRIAALVIFALLAIPLKSYAQPLVIMSVIPFAFVGAIWGHLIMKNFGLIAGLAMPSVMGFIAASGAGVD